MDEVKNEQTPETKPPASVGAETGLTMADLMKAMETQRLAFQAEMDKQRAALVSAHAQLAQIQAIRAAAQAGHVEVEDRHCNSCGERKLTNDGKCPHHPGEKVNEIGTNTLGVKVLLRQV